MNDELTCAELHELAFEYRADELGGTRRVLVEHHLASCPECTTFLANLEALLDAAADAPEPEAETVDQLWAGIASRLPAPSEPQHPALRRARRWALLLAPLATAAVVLIWASWPAPPAADWPARPVATATPPGETEIAVEAMAPSPRVEVDVAPRTTPLPDFERAPTRRLGLAVFVAPEAVWSMADEPDARLAVSSGSLLVEVDAEFEGRVVVEAPDRHIEVVGTVFQVVVERGRSTVATTAGAVLVTENDGTRVRVEAGLEIDPDGVLSPIAPERHGAAHSHIDLVAHHERWAARRASSRPRSERPATRRPPDAQPDADSSRLDAEDSEVVAHADPLGLADHAQREGRYGDAAAILEALLAGEVLTGPQIGLARLELARLYETRLELPARALTHLRRFLREQPDDPAAASARREACRLATDLGLANDCP